MKSNANVKLLNTAPKKATHTHVDTIVISPAVVKGWKNPPFQRPLRVNDKVRALAEEIKRDGGVLPGVITLGVLNKEEYLLDGQHRREAFLLSECDEGYTDVRRHFFTDMAEMGEEFVALNSQLVRLRPDDILRGLEGTIEPLAFIRKKCPFVGYDMIRRGTNSPVLSMSTLLRCWMGSDSEVPGASGGGSAQSRATTISMDEAELCITFLNLAEQAWGRDPEYARLWGALNLTITMWFYRRTVVTAYSSVSARLSKDHFQKCLMAVSANSLYVEWLVGRNMSERDRSPAFGRLKAIFAKRLEELDGKKPKLPSPGWAHHQNSRSTLAYSGK